MKKINPVKLVKLITESYQNKQGIFEQRINAENHIPTNSSRTQKACFLFYTIQLDYSLKSQNLYKGAIQLWNFNRKDFVPKVLSELKYYKLYKILRIYLKPRYINEAVKRWKVNSEKLISNYNRNLLDIFSGTNDAIEILEKINKFRGFGPKIGNFFFRSMMNTFDFKLKKC